MNEREINFLRRHPTYTFLAISLWYPLDGEQLRKYRKALFWDNICENESIDWSAGLIMTFLPHFTGKGGKLSEALHYNERLPWSVDFIRHFEKRWHWEILGELEEIQNNEVIQSEYNKYLEPVNAWLRHLEDPSKSLPEDKHINDNSYTPKILTLEEIDSQKGELDWSELSAGVGYNDWTMDFLMKYENYLQDEMLIMNKMVWLNCFRNITNQEIEALLGDRNLYSQVLIEPEQTDYTEVEKSHFMIPENRTFSSFIKSIYRKGLD